MGEGVRAPQSCLGHSSLSLHPNSRQRKIPLLQQWNLGFVLLFNLFIFFKALSGSCPLPLPVLLSQL